MLAKAEDGRGVGPRELPQGTRQLEPLGGGRGGGDCAEEGGVRG